MRRSVRKASKILAWIPVVLVMLPGWCEAQEAKQPTYPVHFVVAKDGSGDFTAIQDAVNKCKAFPDERITITLRPGTYREKVEVYSWTTKISLIGEDPLTTIITFDDYSGKGDVNTFTSWTFKVMGNDFVAENVTFENSAGAVGQAVALHVEADRAIFRNCRFVGNQDTMYAAGENSRQYFKDCYIEGTTDFIFGAATAVFKDCHVHSRKNSYITAASTVAGKRFGYVFMNCRLTADTGITKVYLGRPWRDHARTVFINCEMGSHILPEGWHNWNRPEAQSTTHYAEYKSQGPGAAPGSRVGWSRQLTAKQAKEYTVSTILRGDDNWEVE